MIYIKEKTKNVSQNKDPADLAELLLPGTEGPGEQLELQRLIVNYQREHAIADPGSHCHLPLAVPAPRGQAGSEPHTGGCAWQQGPCRGAGATGEAGLAPSCLSRALLAQLGDSTKRIRVPGETPRSSSSPGRCRCP